MSMVISTSNLLAFSLFLNAFLILFWALKPLSQQFRGKSRNFEHFVKVSRIG